MAGLQDILIPDRVALCAPAFCSTTRFMSPIRALNVEDSKVILDNLVATLEELADVEVIGVAADEQSAVRWIREQPQAFDMMIVDIFLKSGTGLGVLKEVRAAQLPVRRVVLTNYATTDMRERCLALGADRVFDKSNELEDLIAYCGRIKDGSAAVPGALQ
jgi:DNA-binding NarL/FixJ family response regulator